MEQYGNIIPASPTALTTDSDPPTAFFLGRQPILDRKGETVAYELLFRSGETNAATFASHHEATVQVVARAFSELGLQNVLGGQMGFLNFDASMLSCEIVDVLPPELIVLELLEHVEISETIVDCCRSLRERGFHFALDDITALEPHHRAILPYVSYVKVEVLGMPDESIAKLVQQLKPLGLKLLAEKVETIEQANFCASLGFELFQGYYFARPQVLRGKAVKHSDPHLSRLLQLVFADGDLGDIEAVFKRDPKLTYNLLRLVNSVSVGARSRINSIGQAVMLLGRRQLQSWLTLLMFAHKGNGNFPNPLVILAASRGKTLERLAALEGRARNDLDKSYVTGMLSLMETVLEIPLAQICDDLHLDADIRDALLHRSGSLGHHLALVEATERYDTQAVMPMLEMLSLNLEQLTAVQIEAMAWANDIGKEA